MTTTPVHYLSDLSREYTPKKTDRKQTSELGHKEQWAHSRQPSEKKEEKKESIRMIAETTILITETGANGQIIKQTRTQHVNVANLSASKLSSHLSNSKEKTLLQRTLSKQHSESRNLAPFYLESAVGKTTNIEKAVSLQEVIKKCCLLIKKHKLKKAIALKNAHGVVIFGSKTAVWMTPGLVRTLVFKDIPQDDKSNDINYINKNCNFHFKYTSFRNLYLLNEELLFDIELPSPCCG